MTIFSTLRAAIAAETYDSAVVLGAIAEAAQALTGASSAALAMRREGLVICRARSGEMAPEIGSRLSVDSGISGECLRTNRVLRCDDTLKDLRADPEVCRRLGLRSIAAVPLRGRRGTMGVLEAFSTRPYAFAEEHMDYLIRLAELAEAARLRESGVVEAAVEPESSPAVNLVPAPPRAASAAASRALLWARKIVSVRVSGRVDFKRVRIPLAALAVPLLMLLGFSGWSSWHKLPGQAAAKPEASQPEPAPSQASAPVASSELVWKPSPARVAPPQASPNAGIQAAAKREIENTTAQTFASPTLDTNRIAEASPPALTPPDPPEMGGMGPDKSRLAALAAVPVDMPEFGSPVSQGLSGGVLQHKVMPTYPVAALPMRLGGAVVLDATIGEKGNVEDVRIVSGPPLLTAAAIDAVRQWRYSPLLLNGKPVKMQKQISISFRTP